MNISWSRVPLPDVVWFQEGPGLRNWQWTDQGIKVINGRNILTDGQIDLSNTDKFISWDEFREKYEHFGVGLDDIVVTSSGTLGKVGRIRSEHLPLVMNTSVIRFRPKQDAPLDHDYLYCFLRSGDFQDQILSYAIGAAQPNYGPSHLKLMTLPLPPLPIQRRIAGILSAYDELIEISQRRIKILEAMARALYREWFVHFRFPGHESVPRVPSPLGEIPQGWEVTTLGHLVEIRKGKNITKDTIRYGNVPVVAGGITPAYFHDTPNTQSPVITISASGANAGFVNLYHDDVWASDCSFIDASATPHVFYFYLWLDHRRAAVTHLQRGSAQPHVYPKDLAQLGALRAPEELLGAFAAQVIPMFGLMKRLGAEIENLRRTRDLLLPRLLSGQINVEAMQS
jgi:type I restriction enzyme S subunit